MLMPNLPFILDESPLSYASQLAKFHIGDEVVAFLKDTGVKPQDMAANKKGAIARLAELTGVSLGELCANVAIPVGESRYDLRGELVTAEFLANPHTMFCPACLAEDDREAGHRGRWLWTLSVVRTCPRHEIPLMRRAKRQWGDPLHELERRVPERGEQLQALADEAKRRPVSPLQEYVVNRLDGKAGPEWLDAQSLEQAVRATELLGVLLEFGPEQKLPELTADNWDHAGRVGFECTSRGEAGIREVLEAQFSKFADATGTPGARKIFGCFYKALAYSKSLKEPGDIARILREVITENIPMPGGTKVLGETLCERKLHTVASLAKEQSLDSRTLSDVLVAAEVIPENAPAHYPIPVHEGREVAGRVKRMVTVISLPDALGCARPLVDQLIQERLLSPICYGKPGIKGHTQKAVDCEEIAMLVGKLHARAVKLDTETDQLVPISKAAEKAKVPAVIVVHMILGGMLERLFYMVDEQGIAALRVDPAEVKEKASSLPSEHSIVEAAVLLKLPLQTVWRLLDRHPEEVSMQISWIDCPSQDHCIPRIPLKEIANFKARYIQPSRIAEQYGLRVCVVESLLKRRGIKPVLSEKKVGVDFYRTRVLEMGIFALHKGPYKPYLRLEPHSRPVGRLFSFAKLLQDLENLNGLFRFVCEWTFNSCRMANLLAASFFVLNKINELGVVSGQ
ncbi:TniQ family protein [Primorskyibacter marinus]|uniref:TniQ family protein n=1 Tax=Primorskyibacter marinus TaxID=1977320 RepID=UPI000E3063E1|nr:TniQ family protein [Primorskyibacter marinus]